MVTELLRIVDYFFIVTLLLFLNLPLLFLIIQLLKPEQKNYHEIYVQRFYTFLITSYKNIEICSKLIDSILKIEYDRFEIILIADHPEGSLDFRDPRLQIYSPDNTLASKIKSLQSSASHISPVSDAVVILDPDNLVHPAFLKEINQFFQNPYFATQGRRKAKNLNNSIARIDALGEIYHNFTDRSLPFGIGSSASIAGSGICIQTPLFRKFLNSEFLKKRMSQRIILGEDKLMQNYLLLNGYKIAFANKAIVYDEKVLNYNQVTRQRARWIKTYFNNLNDSILLLLKGVTNGSWNKIIFALTTGRLPLFLNLLLCALMMIVHIYLNPMISIIIGLGLLLFLLSFIIVIKKTHSLKLFRNTVKDIPRFIWYQIMALITNRKFNNDFGNTNTSQHLSIEEVMRNDQLP